MYKFTLKKYVTKKKSEYPEENKFSSREFFFSSGRYLFRAFVLILGGHPFLFPM